jgi:hypothetical protein
MPHDEKVIRTSTPSPSPNRDARPEGRLVKTDPNSGSGAWLVAPVQLVPSK